MSDAQDTLVHSQMFAFDLKTGKEEKLHPMNVRRSSFGSVLMGKSIYVFGGYGYSKTNEILNSCERYVEHEVHCQVISGSF